MDDYDKALELIGDRKVDEQIPKTAVKEPKKRKIRKDVVIAGIVIVLLLSLYFYSYFHFSQTQRSYDELIDEAKGKVTIPEGANVSYGRVLWYTQDWARIELKFSFNDKPWDDYLAYLWYNPGNNQSYIQKI